MNDIDALTESIRVVFADRHPWGPDLSYSFSEYVDRIAPVAAKQILSDNLLTTKEDFEKLPFLSIVRDIYGPSPGSGTDYGAVWEMRSSGWHCIASGIVPCGRAGPRLPALLLYKPQQ